LVSKKKANTTILQSKKYGDNKKLFLVFKPNPSGCTYNKGRAVPINNRPVGLLFVKLSAHRYVL
jgi:hypothetical protein